MYVYEIASGKLYSANGNLISEGYSGSEEAKNNPAAVQEVAKGPIPPGLYTMSMIRDVNGQPCDYEDKKKPVIRLIPDRTNEMYGRSGFLIHGDNTDHTASEGCVIMDYPTRVYLASGADNRLEVIAGEPLPAT